MKQFNIEFICRDGMKRHMTIETESIRDAESAAASEKKRLDGLLPYCNAITHYSVARAY